ncbi:MAG: polysaccharide biosynthesis tyrosine autokinase, partial [Candidatus Scalindua sp.]|nr:polysaccharide biosynthesis tyrosine autokinase [Candidatus Scalindua sp.]
RTHEAKKFIERRLSAITKTLQSSQQELKELRQKNRFVSIDNHAATTNRRLEDAEKKLYDTRQKTQNIERLIEHLKFQKSLPKEKVVGFYSREISPVFTTLNDKLDALQLERNVLLIDFTEQHPEVKRIDTEINAVLENMEEHLIAEKKRQQETQEESDAEKNKQLRVFLSLPETTFDMERIVSDIESNQKLLASLEQKYQEVLIKEAEKIQEITIIRPAILPAFPENPPTTIITSVIGAVIGLILGVVMAFVRETMDTSIGTIEDVEEFLGIPVVGVIPFMGTEQIKDILLKNKYTQASEEVLELNARLVSHFAPRSTIAESYRALRTGVDFIAAERQMKILAITSSSIKEGKTTIACNFAMTSAQIGKKVLLIDADLRKPMVNKMFGIEREPGLSDVILGNYNWDEVIRTDTDIMMGRLGMEDITKTASGISNLNIITSGLIPPNPSELLNSSRFSEFLSQVESSYDIVLLDCSPVLPTTDAVIAATKADGVVLVYQVGNVSRGALKRAKAQMENSKANVIGVVLNGLRPETGKDYSDYGYYGLSYAYGAEGGDTEDPWYKKLFIMSKTSGPKFKNWISKWFKVPDVEINLSEKIENSKASKPPVQKSVRREQGSQERTSSLKRRPWKKWLKIIILVAASTFIFYGLLWQSGILKF